MSVNPTHGQMRHEPHPHGEATISIVHVNMTWVIARSKLASIGACRHTPTHMVAVNEDPSSRPLQFSVSSFFLQ
eukprot:6462015-Prymnesium_polylepis.1